MADRSRPGLVELGPGGRVRWATVGTLSVVVVTGVLLWLGMFAAVRLLKCG